MQTLLNKLTGMTWRDYFAALAPAMAGAAVMSAVVIAFQLAARRFLDPLSPAMLASATLLGAAVYVLFFLIVRIQRVDSLRADLKRTFFRRQGSGHGGAPGAGTDGPAEPAVMAGATGLPRDEI